MRSHFLHMWKRHPIALSFHSDLSLCIGVRSGVAWLAYMMSHGRNLPSFLLSKQITEQVSWHDWMLVWFHISLEPKMFPNDRLCNSEPNNTQAHALSSAAGHRQAIHIVKFWSKIGVCHRDPIMPPFPWVGTPRAQDPWHPITPLPSSQLYALFSHGLKVHFQAANSRVFLSR